MANQGENNRRGTRGKVYQHWGTKSASLWKSSCSIVQQRPRLPQSRKKNRWKELGEKIFYQLPPKGHKPLAALIQMCSDLIHPHQQTEVWKTTKNVEEGSIEYFAYGSYGQLHCAHHAQTSSSGCGGSDETQTFPSSLIQSRKVNTRTQFCPSFCTARVSQEQFADGRKRRFSPLHTDTSSSVK